MRPNPPFRGLLQGGHIFSDPTKPFANFGIKNNQKHQNLPKIEKKKIY